MATCLGCGNNIASTKAASLTQFVLGKAGCTCKQHPAKMAKAKLEISYCSRCSKKIQNKSRASLTAFLQNRNYCNCKRTVIVQKTSARLKASQLTSNSKHDEEAVIQAQLQQELETAKTLANTYKLVDSLGEGGMSYVYLAEHTRLHRLVALKIMKADLAIENNEALFREEARKLVLLNHQSLVKVLDFALHEGKWPLIAMELISGETLADRIDRLGPIETDEALSIFKKVAEGLAYIHLKGLVHKDLKPGNIMLAKGSDSEGADEKAIGKSEADVKILDFGISQFNQYGAISQPRTTEIIGSPCYMSPEEWLSGAITPRADLYALGCSLYEALTGHAPYEAVNIDDIREQHINAPYQGLTTNSINPHHSIELELLLKNLLAKDADERPHSAQEVINSLSEILKKDQNHIPKQLDSAPRSVQQMLVLFLATAATIATVCAAAIYCVQRSQQSKAELPTAEQNRREPNRDDFGAIGLIKSVAGSMSNEDKDVSTLSRLGAVINPSGAKTNKSLRPIQISAQDGAISVLVPHGVPLGFLQMVGTKVVSKEISLIDKVTIDPTRGKLFWSMGSKRIADQQGMSSYIEQMSKLPLFGMRSYCSSNSSVQKAIYRMKELISLELYGSEQTESCVLPEIDNLSHLRYLTVLRQNFSLIENSAEIPLVGETEADKVAKLKILPQLEYIEVGEIGKLTNLIAKLSSSKKLKFLAILSSELSEDDCRQIAKIKQLKWLILSKTRVTPKSIDTLLSMANLEAIDFTDNYIKVSQINQIADTSSLKFIFTNREKLGLSSDAFNSLKEKLAVRNIRLKDGTETWTARGFWDDPVGAYRLR